MKLKIVALAISPKELIFMIFFTFHSQVISLQTLLGQTSPMPRVKGLIKDCPPIHKLKLIKDTNSKLLLNFFSTFHS